MYLKLLNNKCDLYFNLNKKKTQKTKMPWAYDRWWFKLNVNISMLTYLL